MWSISASSPRLTRRFPYHVKLRRRIRTCWQICMLSCMLNCMPSTSVRIDRATHEELKRLADKLGKTVGETVALAIRRLRQERIGRELTAPLTREDTEWLDADFG